MKITYTSPGTPKLVEAEVEFPIYREHRLDNCTIYTKIVNPRLEVNVEEHEKENSGRVFWKIETADADMQGCFSDQDYLLGLGRYRCSAATFERVYAQAQKTIRWSLGSEPAKPEQVSHE